MPQQSTPDRRWRPTFNRAPLAPAGSGDRPSSRIDTVLADGRNHRPCVTWFLSLTNNFKLVLKADHHHDGPPQVDGSCSRLYADHAMDTDRRTTLRLLARALDRVRWVLPKAERASIPAPAQLDQQRPPLGEVAANGPHSPR